MKCWSCTFSEIRSLNQIWEFREAVNAGGLEHSNVLRLYLLDDEFGHSLTLAEICTNEP